MFARPVEIISRGDLLESIGMGEGGIAVRDGAKTTPLDARDDGWRAGQAPN